MVKAGVIHKHQGSVYTSFGAPVPDAETPTLSKLGVRPSHRRVLALLTEPKSAPALREALGVSRQGVDQLLKAMLKAGIIRRFEIERERGSFLYVCKESYKKGSLRDLTPELHPSRARLLSALPLEAPSRLRDFASTGSSFTTNRSLGKLSALGLVVIFKLGRDQYVAITWKGIQHPQHDPNCPKAPVADIIRDFGEARVSYIQFLQVLHTARARDLTAAMPKGYFDDRTWKSGQVIQRLQMENLIEKVDAGKGRHACYRLTEKGHFIAGMLCRIRPLLSPTTLRQNIAAHRREHTGQFLWKSSESEKY
jgi:DNA-binding MarR family transcriptional regulator